MERGILRAKDPQQFREHLGTCRRILQKPRELEAGSSGSGSGCLDGVRGLLHKLFPCCHCASGGESYYNQDFRVRKVKVEGVEEDLVFAKAGSNVPESLQGIFWLDMFYRSSVAKDPMYTNKPWWLKEGQSPSGEAPDLETLVSFGDHPGKWDPESRVFRDCGYCGDAGHWTFPDTEGGAFQVNSAILVRMNADLVFQDEGLTEAWVSARIKVPATALWLEVPRFVFEMMMYKSEYGWCRRTTAGNLPDYVDHNDVLQQLLPGFAMSILQNGEKGDWWNYPMVRIVDGAGQRTQYYDEYVAFMRSHYGPEQQLCAALAQ